MSKEIDIIVLLQDLDEKDKLLRDLYANIETITNEKDQLKKELLKNFKSCERGYYDFHPYCLKVEDYNGGYRNIKIRKFERLNEEI